MNRLADTTELPLTMPQLRRLEVTRDDPTVWPTICCAFRIPGGLNVDRFTDSIEVLVSRHEALRVEITQRPGAEPCQRIRGLPLRHDLLSCHDVLARSEEQFGRYVRHITAEARRTGWDTGAYPFRFQLFQYNHTVQVLLVALSHMAVDRIGTEILIRDLMGTYADILAGRRPHPPPQPNWASSVLRQVAAGGKGARRSVEKDLSGLPCATQFNMQPGDPAQRGGSGRRLSLSLTGTELAALRAKADFHGCTEFIWVLAAFARTVFRFTAQDRIKISVPVNLRSPEERAVVGMYVLTVPVVIERPEDADSDRRFVDGVGSALLRAMVRYRRSMPQGAEGQADLFVIYQKMSSMDSREFSRWDTEYMPRIGYSTEGMSLYVNSYPDVLDVQALLHPGVFSADSALRVSETLSRNLAPDSDREERHSAW